MTGVLPQHHDTLAETLDNFGYRTLGSVGNLWLSSFFGYAQGFEEYFETDRPDLGGIHEAETVFGKTVNRLEKIVKSKEPFFLYLHFNDVHGPYQCSEEDFKILKTSTNLGAETLLSQSDLETQESYIGKWITWMGPREKQSLQFWRTCYAAGVRNFDRKLGDIFEQLRKNGLFDNSVVILTADHGEELYEHKGWVHGTSLYYHQTHVPLIMYLPKGRYAGTRVEGLVSSIDIMPTILSLANINYSDMNLKGQNLLPLLKNNEDDRYAYSEYVNFSPNIHSIQDKDFKLILNIQSGSSKLFNVKKDKFERINVAKENKSQVKRLGDLLIEHIDNINKGNPQSGLEQHIPEDIKEGLKSLGYLQ